MSRVAAAARGLVGRRFRLHGRAAPEKDGRAAPEKDGRADPERGRALDCVGVAAAALAAAGWQGAVPTGYALRGGNPDVVAALLDTLLAREETARAGDVVLMAAGPGQLHLGIVTAVAAAAGSVAIAGFVHADAGLGRVVERPGAPPWPVLGLWRWRED